MIVTGKYPALRLRRNRKENWARRLVQENSLSSSDFILPIFLMEGKNKKETIKTMPDVFRYTVDKLEIIVNKAIKGILFFIALSTIGLSLSMEYL